MTLLDRPVVNGMIINVPIPEHFTSYIMKFGVALAEKQAQSINEVLTYMSQNEGTAYIDKRDFVANKSRASSIWKDTYGYG